jgi:hypothetical protein
MSCDHFSFPSFLVHAVSFAISSSLYNPSFNRFRPAASQQIVPRPSGNLPPLPLLAHALTLLRDCGCCIRPQCNELITLGTTLHSRVVRKHVWTIIRGTSVCRDGKDVQIEPTFTRGTVSSCLHTVINESNYMIETNTMERTWRMLTRNGETENICDTRRGEKGKVGLDQSLSSSVNTAVPKLDHAFSSVS